ncbi:hypothetical protein ILYODFUR_005192 [Ilyodon furcidens]|uniref:Uncharacterized protein n=1 Tax=Ilyodon furcidens TaxID=33524 RepID=A0ABV0UP76_9TELE
MFKIVMNVHLLLHVICFCVSCQWVIGPAYFVEFTVLETVCSKETDVSELAHCPPMNCQFAHRGFCTGSHMTLEETFKIINPVGKDASSFQKRESVDVKCEIYEPQVLAVFILIYNSTEILAV